MITKTFLSASSVFNRAIDDKRQSIKRERAYIEGMKAKRKAFTNALRPITKAFEAHGLDDRVVSVYVNSRLGGAMHIEVFMYDMKSYKDPALMDVLMAAYMQCDESYDPKVKDGSFTASREYMYTTRDGMHISVNVYLDTNGATCKIEKVTETTQVTKYKVTCD